MPRGETTKLLWKNKKFRAKMLKSLWIKKGDKLPFKVWNKGKKGLQVAWNKGLDKSDERIKKYIRKGEKHHNWKGTDVSYRANHAWVERELGRPEKCEHCKKNGLTGYKINWANKSGEYLREKEDWIRLCVSCHRVYDFKKRKAKK